MYEEYETVVRNGMLVLTTLWTVMVCFWGLASHFQPSHEAMLYALIWDLTHYISILGVYKHIDRDELRLKVNFCHYGMVSLGIMITSLHFG